jgi:hypothetical protein
VLGERERESGGREEKVEGEESKEKERIDQDQGTHANVVY